MICYIVTANDHDYMSEWVVGVFATEELANLAIAQDMKEYEGHLVNGMSNCILLILVENTCQSRIG